MGPKTYYERKVQARVEGMLRARGIKVLGTLWKETPAVRVYQILLPLGVTPEAAVGAVAAMRKTFRKGRPYLEWLNDKNNPGSIYLILCLEISNTRTAAVKALP